jgi:hypothetical protein
MYNTRRVYIPTCVPIHTYITPQPPMLKGQTGRFLVQGEGKICQNASARPVFTSGHQDTPTIASPLSSLPAYTHMGRGFFKLRVRQVILDW